MFLKKKSQPLMNEIVHTKESFLKRGYEGDLFGTREIIPVLYICQGIVTVAKQSFIKGTIIKSYTLKSWHLLKIKLPISNVESKTIDDITKRHGTKLKGMRIELKEN